jgi:DNA-binding beta-propeller fold protein YncE
LRQAEPLTVLQDGQQLYFDASANGQWMVHDLAGRLVAQGQTLQGRNPVSTQHLPDGLYVLTNRSETGELSSALVPSVQR